MKEIKTTKTILKEMLQELIPFIKGPWFLSDGGLLGIVRNGDLLNHDDDLDIYLMPGTIIEIPDDHNLAICDYYMEQKVYRKDEPKFNPNLWLEYLSYLRCIPEARGMNRSQLFSLAKSRYAVEQIVPEFSKPYIDIFKLEYGEPLSYHYCIPYWTDFKNQYYTITEVENLQENNDLGFKIFIPKKTEDVLERLYGKDWRIENQKFLY